MKRLHLFEFEDLNWFPATIRSGMTDYLRFVFCNFHIYDPTAKVLKRVMDKTKENTIVDICTGAGGGITMVIKSLKKIGKKNFSVKLTDKYPNVDAYKLIQQENPEDLVEYSKTSVDATKVSSDIKGIRTLYTSFHHFKPKAALQILKDAVEANSPICIFEGAERNPLWILFVIVITPLICFISAPFVRPFKWSRLIFTYLIPLIPLCTMWDGVISFLRLYSRAEMKDLISKTNSNYKWEVGKLRHPMGFRIVYMAGYPVTA